MHGCDTSTLCIWWIVFVQSILVHCVLLFPCLHWGGFTHSVCLANYLTNLHYNWLIMTYGANGTKPCDLHLFLKVFTIQHFSKSLSQNFGKPQKKVQSLNLWKYLLQFSLWKNSSNILSSKTAGNFNFIRNSNPFSIWEIAEAWENCLDCAKFARNWEIALFSKKKCLKFQNFYWDFFQTTHLPIVSAKCWFGILSALSQSCKRLHPILNVYFFGSLSSVEQISYHMKNAVQ